MKTKNKSLLGLCCLLSLIFAACEAKEPNVQSPYPVTDSGVWANENTNIYWLSNNRVLFLGSVETDKAIQRRPENLRLAIWDIGKGVTVYSSVVLTVPTLGLGGFCYSGGIINYIKPPNLIMYGKLGEEKPTQLDPNKKYYRDEMNCRIHEIEQLMAQRKNRAIIPLLDRHGYLDRGALRGEKSLKPVPTVLYRPGQREAITLPIRIGGVQGYYAFKDAYYIETGAYAINGTPPTTWWLYPDGRVEEIRLPTGPWGTGFSAHTIPLRTGLLIVSHAYRSAKDSGLAGGYFVQGEKFVKVVNGAVNRTAVSPDGCKVAFSHALYLDADLFDDPAHRTLKLINFCTEEKNNAK